MARCLSRGRPGANQEVEVSDEARMDRAQQGERGGPPLGMEDLEEILATIPQFVLVVDRNGVIRYINRVEEGYDRHAVIGADSATILDPGSVDIFRSAVEAAVETGEEQQYEVQIPAPNGTRRWYRSRMFPLSPAGRVDSVLVMAVDVSELKSVQETLDRLRRLLPVCAWCDRIRNEKGDWVGVEVFLRDVTGTDVTHGLCPDCSEKQFGELKGRGGANGDAA